VRELFGDQALSVETTRRTYVERAASPADYCELFKASFGPMVALRTALGDRAEAFDRDFLDFATRSNRGTPSGPAEYPYEYLLVVVRKQGG
jgi:hypothetical protein